jgi:type I restriction enzyme S subunit
MNAETLRNSILQLAISGKLVDQREEEGTAEELCQQIIKEKEQLLKEGKIKKSKPLLPIQPDEIPFEIPPSWKWVKLNEISIQMFSGRTPKYSLLSNENFIIGQKNNQETGLEFYPIKYGKDDFFEHYPVNMFLRNEDVILNTLGGGTVGRCGIFIAPNKKKFITDGHLFVFRTGKSELQWYLYYLLKAGKRQIEKMAEGTTNQSFLKIGQLESFLIPLPPISEQKRIVEKIEELLPLVEEYGEANSRLESLNIKFPDEIKQSILQYTIQGKLVEQREEEGTAEELYQQILKEKEQLIKEGKIKKSKPLSAIRPEEIPFEIPSSWKWVRLDDIGSWKSGQTPLRGDSSYYKGDIPWLKTGDLNNDIIFEVSENITAKAVSDYNLRINPKNTVLIAMYGATIGKVGLLEIEACTNQACCACLTHENVFPKFLFYYLLHRQQYYSSLGAGGAQPNISRGKIVNSVFPLPPLYEQKRIVEKIEEFMQLLNELKGEVS